MRPSMCQAGETVPMPRGGERSRLDIPARSCVHGGVGTGSPAPPLLPLLALPPNPHKC